MLPDLDIFGIGFKSFGLFLALAFICSGLLAYRRLQELGKPAEWAYEAVFAALVGGLVGARVYYLTQNLDEIDGDILGNLFGGSGLVFYGGLIGGALAVCLWAWWRGMLGVRLLDWAAPSLAIGYAVGRIGCQVSGDGDYGIPADVPWAMAYPDGVVPTDEEVHPTPIYETLVMGLVTLFLWRMRDRVRPGILFAIWLTCAGIERFLVEFIRRNEAAVTGLTAAQIESLIAAAAGIVWMIVVHRRHGGILKDASGTPAATTTT